MQDNKIIELSDLSNNLGISPEEKQFLESIGSNVSDAFEGGLIPFSQEEEPTFKCDGSSETLEERKFEMSMENFQELIDNFLPPDKLGLDMSKFDFRILTADWYKQKYPYFDEKVYDILEKCSEKKIATLLEEQPSMTIEHGEFNISFK